METPYSKTDRTIEYLAKRYAQLFRRVNSFDELDVVQVSHEIYDGALALTEREAARLVKAVYDKYREEEEISPEDALALVLALMTVYHPVTKYVYRNEVDRKRSRFVEGVLSSETPREEVELAKRLLVGLNKQFLDDVTFEAVIQAYADDGVEQVRWITARDDRRCRECKSRHNKIYPIEEIPPKPHLHCRCWVEKVTG